MRACAAGMRSGAVIRDYESFPIFLSCFWSPYCLLIRYMATTIPLAPPANDQALVPSSHPPPTGSGIALTIPLARLPVELDVSVPVRRFRVRNLLALEPGDLIESEWGHGEDVPLAAGQVQLAWSEFEVQDTQLAVRVTRLA
jgi:flagellar motor switch/type III secretory pathway protein FliN